jgi:hypothetical protein
MSSCSGPNGEAYLTIAELGQALGMTGGEFYWKLYRMGPMHEIRRWPGLTKEGTPVRFHVGDIAKVFFKHGAASAEDLSMADAIWRLSGSDG